MSKQSQDMWWLRQIERYNAVRIEHLSDAKKYPNRAIVLESRDFGYIYGARGTGETPDSRKLILKY